MQFQNWFKIWLIKVHKHGKISKFFKCNAINSKYEYTVRKQF